MHQANADSDLNMLGDWLYISKMTPTCRLHSGRAQLRDNGLEPTQLSLSLY